jgi:hypothetical protein
MSETKSTRKEPPRLGKGRPNGKKKPYQSKRLYGEAPPTEMDSIPGVRELVLRSDKTSNYMYWKEEMEKHLYRYFEEVGDVVPPRIGLDNLKSLRARTTALEAAKEQIRAREVELDGQTSSAATLGCSLIVRCRMLPIMPKLSSDSGQKGLRKRNSKKNSQNSRLSPWH